MVELAGARDAKAQGQRAGEGVLTSCPTCADFEVLALVVVRSRESSDKVLRARVLIERFRLEHERSHLTLERDPFPRSEAPTDPEVPQAKADRRCSCGCLESIHYPLGGETPPTEIGGGRSLCSGCFACQGFRPG
jgi:hypothetical protein